MRSALLLVPRQNISTARRTGVIAGGLAAGLGAAAAVLLASGVSLSAVLGEFVIYVFFDRNGLAQTLTAATPLILTGLCASVALKLKFWNIGIEGQIWLGAIAATWVAVCDIGPDGGRLFLMFAAASAGGIAWIVVPALLRLCFGVSEVISTLLLSYVALLLAQHLLYGVWRDPDTGFPISPQFDPDVERLARLGLGNLHTGLWIALGIGLVMWALLQRSRFGFFVSAVGSNPLAAVGAGIPVLGVTLGAVMLSGGLAGLAGAVIVAGQEYRLTQFIAQGYTFSGIVIACIARFHPLAVVVAAIAIGGVYTAGDALKVFYQLPSAVVTLLESVMLLGLLLAEFFGRYRLGVARSVG